MANSKFNQVGIKGIVTVVPEKVISIDDELRFFDNNPKKLERSKKMVGFGTRHVLGEDQTVVDMCEAAAEILIRELSIDRNAIDALILVTQSPDYAYPASACILHGRLNLTEECAALDVGLGCSGYVYGLWLAHSLIGSGAAKNVLLLAGDDASKHSVVENRLSNPLFGDAASATWLTKDEQAGESWFALGTRGKGWDRIVAPATGRRFPVRKDISDIEIHDNAGNVWHPWDEIIKGMDVFNFTMDVVPRNIEAILSYSHKSKEDIDFFVIHQANKQIVDTIIAKTNIELGKSTSLTFSKYGNNSTNSVATVIGDALYDKKNLKEILVTTFGVGLSWATCIVDIHDTVNLGIRVFNPIGKIKTRQEQLDIWIKHFKGE